ncbi:MAG: cytochrome c oxidase subunit II [Pseudomonadota bacterium]
MFNTKASRVVASIAAAAMFAPIATHAAWTDLNLPVGVTPLSKEVYELHMLILWICVVIGVVVFGAMFYSMFAHRKSRGVEPATFHHSTLAEIVWTVIPIVILVVMAVPATRTLIAMEDTSESQMTLKVTGYQWKWRYDYIEDSISMWSNLAEASKEVMYSDPTGNEDYLLDVDNEVVLPIHTKIRLMLTADDVIHAWWVPKLGQKKDAIPGYINEIWTYIEEPGTYRGQCAELCGKDHGFMPIVVKAVTKDEYRAWVDTQKEAEAEAARLAAAALLKDWSKEELMAKGEEVYINICSTCHKKDGLGDTGAGYPSIAGSTVVLGPADGHISLVLDGIAGTQMSSFGSLSDADLAAVLTYQRNAFGNEASLIQPKDVNGAR